MSQKNFSLLIFSSLFFSLISPMTWATSEFPLTRKQIFGQLTPPSPNGGCQTHSRGWVENGYQGVQWQKVPKSRTFVGGYDEGYSWIGINTISRKGNAINFDFVGQDVYVRYSANCKTGVYAIIRASDSVIDPTNYHPVNEYIGQVLDFACSISRGK